MPKEIEERVAFLEFLEKKDQLDPKETKEKKEYVEKKETLGPLSHVLQDLGPARSCSPRATFSLAGIPSICQTAGP